MKKGFTIVEVTLVLAITSLLVIGVMSGTTASLARQRYNDAVNSLVSYLRSVYSEAINIENSRTSNSEAYYCSISPIHTTLGENAQGTYPEIGELNPGRTNCVIYGKLLTFGEKDADGTPKTTIHTYDVIGNIYSTKEFDTSTISTDLDALYAVGSDVLSVSNSGTGSSNQFRLILAGNSSSYDPDWDATIETMDSSRKLYRGALLITRSPLSGTIHTYSLNYGSDTSGNSEKLDIQKTLAENTATHSEMSFATNLSLSSLLKDATDGDDATSDDFNSTSDTIICLGSEDLSYLDGNRRAIRFKADGRNATAVELLNADEQITIGDETRLPCQS